MSQRAPTIFISAAEASGDAHAARLAESLRHRLPACRLVAAGGPRMAAAGCEMLAELTEEAGMLTDPLGKLGYYWLTIRRLRRAIGRLGPDLHVPVDSPALNWHLAAAAKNVGAKVVHYVAPQVWAWAPWRVKKLARLTDHVACILPFEPDWLRQRGVPATYVGHPMFDYLPARGEVLPDILAAWAEGNWRVVLLAGSRPGEIRRHSRALAAVAETILRRWPDASCTFAAGDGRAAELIRASLPTDGLRYANVAAGRTHAVIAASHLAVTTSGTITLETAYFGVPMVIFYRAGRIAYKLVGRWLIRTPRLSLVNILAGRELAPELIPWHGRHDELADMVLEIMDDPGYLLAAREELLALVEGLRTDAALPPGKAVSDNVADLIAGLLDGPR